jgi:peptidoglycan/xylan/chitin deacetylase (PgdA/CDA1 family)
MASANLIISLDCEGKWGMADKMGPEYGWLTQANLTNVYREICDLFAEYQTKTTFGFVGAFVLPMHRRDEYLDQIRAWKYQGKNWSRFYEADRERGDVDGWFCPEALSIARDAGHELASHGFSHIPFDDPTTAKEDLAKDMELVRLAARDCGFDPRTFIYPRNGIGHTDLIDSNEFVGYRDQLPIRGRASSLLREFNIFEKAQPKAATQAGSTVKIPSGYFLNWRKGARARVPHAVSVARWKSILNSAVQSNGVAHLWFHPHNLISAPTTRHLLEAVLNHARSLREKGKLNIVTQEEYCLLPSAE